MTILDHALAVADLYATILGRETEVEATGYPLNGWTVLAGGVPVAVVSAAGSRSLLTAAQLRGAL